MNQSEIKRKVRQFRQENKIKNASAEELAEAFKKQGFLLIEYNTVLNDADIETIIHSFGLEDLIVRTNGFIYTDNNHRLIFIREGLTDAEKALVLAHEEGHYYLGHTNRTSCIGRNVTEEYEANEFAHFLLQRSVKRRFIQGMASHKKAVVAGIVAAVAAGGAGIGSYEYGRYQERQIYEGEFYVTMHGEKYHRKNCVTIQGHEIRRLTKEDVENDTYLPCEVCQPDQS